MSWAFAYPWALWFLSVVPLLWIVAAIAARSRRGVEISVPTRVAACPTSWRVRLRFVPWLFVSLALVGAVIALARPRKVISDSKSTRDAIAIQLVVDRSGSMDEPVNFHGVPTNRLEAVKEVVEQFVMGNGDSLKGREGDLLGLIVFGTYADTIAPLTRSHETLVESLRRVELPRVEQERSTAIGDALVLACARLKAAEDAMGAQLDEDDFEIKSKAVVLLTDGENRSGDFSPDQGAQLAADWGIRVYIVGIGGNTRRGNGFFNFAPGRGVNTERMTRVAQSTGGRYWEVESLDQLTDVYATIDELERTTIRVTESTRYDEHFEIPLRIALGAFLLAALTRTVLGTEGV